MWSGAAAYLLFPPRHGGLAKLLCLSGTGTIPYWLRNNEPHVSWLLCIKAVRDCVDCLALGEQLPQEHTQRALQTGFKQTRIWQGEKQTESR